MGTSLHRSTCFMCSLAILSLAIATSGFAQQESDPFGKTDPRKKDPPNQEVESGDPFAKQSGQEDDDPFGNSTTEGLAKARAAKIAAVEAAELAKIKQIQKTAEIAELRSRLVEYHKDNSFLRNEIAQLQAEISRANAIAVKTETLRDRAEAKIEIASSFQNELFQLVNELVQEQLTTKNAADQQEALSLVHRIAVLTTQNMGSLRANWLSDESKSILEQLASSQESEIANKAVRTIQTYSPIWAIEQGVQKRGDYWLPMEAIEIGDSAPDGKLGFRERLNSPTKMDYFETRLEDVMAEIQADYKINVWFANRSDQETLVTFRAENANLGSCLSSILDEQKLAFVFRDDVLKIYPEGSPELVTTLTFQLNGLTRNGTGVMDVVTLAESTLSDLPKDISRAGENRILVTGTEDQLRSFSKLLAKLNSRN